MADVTSAPVGNDRQRQMAAAAWILGWIGGPVPAVLMLVVAPRGGWARRHLVWAAAFWTVMWVTLFVLLFVVSRNTVAFGAFAVMWIAAVVIAFAVTMLGARAAVTASRRSNDPRRQS